MQKNNWMLRLGLILIIISIPLFLSLPFIPFLDLENNQKLTFATIVFISAEVLFWSGGLLIGKELFQKYKSRLNPKAWFKKRSIKT